MAKKQVIDPIILEIREAIKNKSAVVGTSEVIKKLRVGKLAKAYISLNCEKIIKEDIVHYAKLANCEVVELKYPNDELGILCKKPFSISVFGLAKGD